mgnify:CR=1 FL=1
MPALTPFIKIERHFGLWLFIFLLTSSAMGIALYYQYALAWEPCVLCVHVRIYMLGIMLLSGLMMFLGRFQGLRTLGFLAQSTLAIPLFLTCRQLYRVEVGLEQAGCLFSAGLPTWFDLEAWLPAIFEVRSTCGESPVVFANITMAESLYIGSAFSMGCAILLALLSIVVFFRNFKNRFLLIHLLCSLF